MAAKFERALDFLASLASAALDQIAIVVSSLARTSFQPGERMMPFRSIRSHTHTLTFTLQNSPPTIKSTLENAFLTFFAAELNLDHFSDTEILVLYWRTAGVEMVRNLLFEAHKNNHIYNF